MNMNDLGEAIIYLEQARKEIANLVVDFNEPTGIQITNNYNKIIVLKKIDEAISILEHEPIDGFILRETTSTDKITI